MSEKKIKLEDLIARIRNALEELGALIAETDEYAMKNMPIVSTGLERLKRFKDACAERKERFRAMAAETATGESAQAGAPESKPTPNIDPETGLAIEPETPEEKAEAETLASAEAADFGAKASEPAKGDATEAIGKRPAPFASAEKGRTPNYEDKKTQAKKNRASRNYRAQADSDKVQYDQNGQVIVKIRPHKKSVRAKNRPQAVAPIEITHVAIDSEVYSMKHFSEKIGKPVTDIISKLFNELDIVKTINDCVNCDEMELIADSYGITVERKIEMSAQDILESESVDIADENPDDLVARPPVVTIMGHVDHGKTSILDRIRLSNVASGEAGGITQHIGAYAITKEIEGADATITFLDTPGHEAFTAMRARGAQVTDIAVIVVAIDDGLKPQTIEAINHAKAAKVPIIVAINKIDLPGIDIAKSSQLIFNQLTACGVTVEEWGGQTPVCLVSAKTGENIDKLLELIHLYAEGYADLRVNPNRAATGVIIEARLDKGLGPVATVLVQNGTLRPQDNFIVGTTYGKIKRMLNDKGATAREATPGLPVLITGLAKVPEPGDKLQVVSSEKFAKTVSKERLEAIAEKRSKRTTASISDYKTDETKVLNVVLKVDVQGSIEPIRKSIENLSDDEVTVSVIHSGVGAVSETDVTLAYTSNAIVVGFNIRPDANANALLARYGVTYRFHSVIYEALQELQAARDGMLAPTIVENVLGQAEVRQLFKIKDVGTIAGCQVIRGKIQKNVKIRVMRDSAVVAETSVESLKRKKDSVTEVASGFDCGIGLSKFSDVHVGDVLEAYALEEAPREQ